MTVSCKLEVRADVNYTLPSDPRPQFFANDQSRNRVPLDTKTVAIQDARARTTRPSLLQEGFELFPHESAIRDFRVASEVARIYPEEVQRLILEITGADTVVIAGPATLRFGERSAEAGTRDNSRAARLVHIDSSDLAAAEFARQAAPPQRGIRRAAQHNIWRTFSSPPQDVPLAVCDARSVLAEDLIPADAMFDRDGAIVWSFEALLLRYSPTHRWYYFSNMTAAEVLVFKRHDTDPKAPHFVPHSAFTHPQVPEGTPPRASVEMRTIAYWFE
jgi:hypothetical protein